MSIEQNGTGPPIDRMDEARLERIRRFTQRMRAAGGEVYLGATGVPFTIEGAADGHEGLRVDLEAIEAELVQRGGSGG